MEKKMMEMAQKMGEAYESMARKMATKIRLVRTYVDRYENMMECPYYSEWKGMEQALYIMGIDYQYDFGEDLEITAVIVEGHKVEL